jgi:hypothetical protein
MSKTFLGASHEHGMPAAAAIATAVDAAAVDAAATTVATATAATAVDAAAWCHSHGSTQAKLIPSTMAAQCLLRVF